MPRAPAHEDPVMAFWGGFMAQDGPAEGDLGRALGWIPTRTGIQVTWPVYIYVAEPGFGFDLESLGHLEFRP